MGLENENKASNPETSKNPLLKAKSKILKKSINNALKKKKASSLQIREKRKIGQGKNVVKCKENSCAEEGDAKKSNSYEESRQNTDVAEEQNKKEQQILNLEITGGLEKDQVDQKSNEKLEASKTSPKIEKDKEIPNGLEKSQQNETRKNKKNKQKLRGSNKTLKIVKDKENTNVLETSQQNEKKVDKKKENLVGSNKSMNIKKDAENPSDLEQNGKRGSVKKKEKLGGLIFMCSSKTKPDCFRYRVMGVSIGKRDLLQSLKPGLKLFLYDFDLKLMYGIYRATSSGGMSLEPKAFGGSFPVQVRFSIHRDCYPLSDIIFKKAMKENFTSRNKFKTELTVEQARKLSDLFQSAEVRPSLSVAASRDKAVREERESRPHSRRGTYSRDPYSSADGRSYHVHSRERDGCDVHREMTHDLYFSEKDFRAYGLKRKRKHSSHRSISPSVDLYSRDRDREHLLTRHAIAPTLDLYQRERDRDYVLTQRPITTNVDHYQRDRNRDNLFTQHPIATSVNLFQRDRDRDLHLRHPDLVYRSTELTQKEYVGADRLYMTELEYRASAFGGRLTTGVMASTSATGHRDDQYYTRLYSTSLVDPYTQPPRREARYSLNRRSDPIEIAHVRRRERRGSVEGAWLYSADH